MRGTGETERREGPQASEVPGAGGPRSAATRRAILGAARATFAARGYDQTTIRAVAARAGIDASMVMRYFGSKAGLFTAAATINLRPLDLRTAPPGDRAGLLVGHFVGHWEKSLSDDSLVFLLRTAVTHEPVTRQLQATFNDLIAGPVAALGVDHAGQRGALIATQLLGLALCRYILRLEPLASIPAGEVVAAITPTVQRYLTSEYPPPEPFPAGGNPAAGA